MEMGQYIVCDGPDFTGKSTVISLLAECLKKNNINSVITRHPGATPVGKKIREMVRDPKIKMDPFTRGILFAADNFEFQASIALPMMESEDWLLADRSNFISSLAYQIVDGCSMKDLQRCHEVVVSYRKIDYCFILTAHYDAICDRKAKRDNEVGKQDEYYERDKDWFYKVRDAYISLSKNADLLSKFAEEVHYIDASQPIENVMDDIVSLLPLHVI